jgi:hypothetical protein
MGYEISIDGGSIKCLQCGMVSHHPKDVELRYCARCRMYHDEYERLGRDVYRPKRPFRFGETVVRDRRKYRVLADEGLHGKVQDGDGRELYPFFWFDGGEWCEREQ